MSGQSQSSGDPPPLSPDEAEQLASLIRPSWDVPEGSSQSPSGIVPAPVLAAPILVASVLAAPATASVNSAEGPKGAPRVGAKTQVAGGHAEVKWSAPFANSAPKQEPPRRTATLAMGGYENTGAPPLAELLMRPESTDARANGANGANAGSAAASLATAPGGVYVHSSLAGVNAAGSADSLVTPPKAPAIADRTLLSPAQPDVPPGTQMQHTSDAHIESVEPAIPPLVPAAAPTRIEKDFFESMPSPALMTATDEWEIERPQRRPPSKIGKTVVGAALAIGMGIVGFASIRYAFVREEDPVATRPMPALSSITERPIAPEAPHGPTPAVAASEIPPPDVVLPQTPSATAAAKTVAPNPRFEPFKAPELAKPSVAAKDPFGTRLAPPAVKTAPASFGRFEPKPKAPAVVAQPAPAKPAKSGSGIVRDNPF